LVLAQGVTGVPDKRRFCACWGGSGTAQFSHSSSAPGGIPSSPQHRDPRSKQNGVRQDHIPRLSTAKLNAPGRSEKRPEGPAPGRAASVCLRAMGHRQKREAGPRKGPPPPEPARARTGMPVKRIAPCSAKTACLGAMGMPKYCPRTNTIPRCPVRRLRQECVILKVSS